MAVEVTTITRRRRVVQDGSMSSHTTVLSAQRKASKSHASISFTICRDATWADSPLSQTGKRCGQGVEIKGTHGLLAL